MLCRALTAFVTMMIYYSTSTKPWSPLPLRTDTASPSRPLRRTYLARGLTGRVQCPVEDDPPHRLVIWSREGHVIQSSDDNDNSVSSRLSVDFGGTLVVEDAQPSDAGDYHCTPYSPRDDAEPMSFIVTVVVKG